MCFFQFVLFFALPATPPLPPPQKKNNEKLPRFRNCQFANVKKVKNAKESGSRSSLLFLLLPRLHCPELECDYRAFGCFLKLVVPQNGWFIMETPIKMDDLGVSLFSETSISHQVDFFRMEFATDGIRDVNWSCTNEKLVLSASVQNPTNGWNKEQSLESLGSPEYVWITWIQISKSLSAWIYNK